MAEGRKCCVYLPNGRKLELALQNKLLGRDLLDIVAAHFKLKEKEYFGIAYKSDSGHYSWLQDDKKVLDHDIAKKSSSRIDLQFAVKFFVESVAQLKHSITIELFFLHIKSLVYKGEFEVESENAFRLASYIMQVTSGDCVDDEAAIEELHKLPVLPNKVTRDHPTNHCEKCVLGFYKELKGYSKGKAILSYMTLAETLPTYGIHYYKVKDKSGIPWWLGLSFKGILQFDFHDRTKAVKTYYWRQLENLYFREKKFSIEVSERHQRLISSSSKGLLSVETHKKSGTEVKVYAWYGSPALIKTIWIMSIAQHHFYLDRKQSKSKLKSVNSLTNLSNDLTNNNHTLISTKKGTPVMTQKQIRDVNVTVKKGSKEESPEVRAAKREMSEALKGRRTELEDRLYDKVQELKKICLQEAELSGKLPPEYIRYMDIDEQPPKIKKRVGAEFKVKLRNKNAASVDRDYPTSVTAASSSSSGFSSEAADPLDELFQLETEFDLLTQIANAAKKLASDPNTKGRTRNKRWGSYKKTIEKLQAVEVKINVLRKKCGQQPSVRASMLIVPDNNDDLFEDGGISLRDGTESERSSLSDGLLLDDDTSLSSGGDALSTHSTPAILNRAPSHPGSAMVGRKNTSPADVDISEAQVKRSLTPPPSFDRTNKMKSSSGTLKNGTHGNQYPMLPSPQSSSGASINSAKTQQRVPISNWFSQKWEIPRTRPNRGWHESSLDSIDTVSTASRQSEDSQSIDHDDSPSRLTAENIQMRIARTLESPAVAQKVDLRAKRQHSTEKILSERPPSANSNQNNHNIPVMTAKKNGDVFHMPKLKREVSDSALSEISVKSNPAKLPSGPSPTESEQKKNDNLPKILEVPPVEHFRKRSSSFTESPSHHIHLPHRGPHKSKTGTLKSNYQPQYVQPSSQLDTYNVQQAHASRMAHEEQAGTITKSRSSQDLQPPIFDTNLNIRMQYLNRSNGHLSLAAPVSNNWGQTTAGTTQPGVVEPGLRRDPSPVSSGYGTSVTPPPPYYVAVPQNIPPMPVDPYGNHPYPYYYAPQQIYNQPFHPEFPYAGGTLTSKQRDMLNNEVYQDIGMGWVPSLYEYSSRASVCESASAQSKKEDILRVLEDHIAMKRTPSNVSSQQQNANLQRRIREQFRASQQQNDQKQSNASREKTWADYQKQSAYAPPASNQDKNTSVPSKQHSPSNEQSRTNLYQHKPPPAPSKEPPQLYKTQKQPRYQQQKSAPSDGQRNRHQPQRWISHPNEQRTGERVSPEATSYREAPTDQKLKHRTGRSGAKSPGGPVGDKDTVVIQALTKSPEGHDVSVFTVTKSAPNTPLPKRHGAPTFFADSSSDDESYGDSSKRDTIKRQPTSTFRRQSADDLLNATRDALEAEATKPYRPPKTPTIIVHTPSFRNRVTPPLVDHGSIETDESSSTPRQRSAASPGKSLSPRQRESSGKSESRGREGRSKDQSLEPPLPPPRLKRAHSRSRQKAAEINRSINDIPGLGVSVSSARARFEEFSNPDNSRLTNKPNRDDRERSSKIHPPAPTRNSSSTPRTAPLNPPRETTPVRTPRSGSSPTIMVHSGTLPRASKSRRKIDRIGSVVSEAAPVPILGDPHLDNSSRERKSRRSSLVGYRTYNDSVPPMNPATPRKSIHTFARSGFTPPPKVPSHSRSRSEAWKVGIQPLSCPAYDGPPPANHYAAMKNNRGPNPNPNAVRYRVDQERTYYDRGGPPLHRGKLSASAEDLLWSDASDNQAGTLV